MIRICEFKRLDARRAAATFLPVFMLLLIAPSLRAQSTWVLKISEKEKQLADGTDPMWMKALMWDMAYARMNARNMPTFELMNTAAAGTPSITQIQMTIGDTRFHFTDDYLGVGAKLGTTTPGFNLTPSITNSGNLLTVDIAKQGGTGGLAPGELVRFKIDLDVDAGQPFFVHPDYRTVLFDMNGTQVYGPDPAAVAGQDNSVITLKFSDGTLSTPLVLLDEIVPQPQSLFFNENFRPYGLMEPVQIFEIPGGSPGEIPEPSAAALACAGLFGGAWCAVRSRRYRPPAKAA